jgi:hypothetical protein
MFLHALPFAGVPSGGLDMTADFAPLLVGTWVILGLCFLALAFAIGFHDTREAQQKVGHTAVEPTALPKAA